MRRGRRTGHLQGNREQIKRLLSAISLAITFQDGCADQAPNTAPVNKFRSADMIAIISLFKTRFRGL
jgi:hypothetical protein